MIMCVACGSKWKFAYAEYEPTTLPTPVYCPPNNDTAPMSFTLYS